jgi:type IV secretion system protein VirB9
LRLILAVIALACANPAMAQSDSRVQSVRWAEGQDVLLVAQPETALSVALEPDETILGMEVADRAALAVRMTARRDGFQVLPQREGDLGTIDVMTTQRTYRFRVRTGLDARAAWLVRLDSGGASEIMPTTASSAPAGEVWGYRLVGDALVLPSRISDDGVRTRIEFPKENALPAIFAVGPSGEEQLVNGYMRGDAFEIDRVWNELVFRIDKQTANARRNPEPDNGDG